MYTNVRIKTGLDSYIRTDSLFVLCNPMLFSYLLHLLFFFLCLYLPSFLAERLELLFRKRGKFPRPFFKILRVVSGRVVQHFFQKRMKNPADLPPRSNYGNF